MFLGNYFVSYKTYLLNRHILHTSFLGDKRNLNCTHRLVAASFVVLMMYNMT